MNVSWTSLLFCLILFLKLPNFGIGQIDNETEANIDAMVDTLLHCRDLVSLNLAVVHNGEVVLTKGYGMADLEGNKNNTAETQYAIASTTKAFSATLLGFVMEDTNYTWDTTVRDILGEDLYFSEWALTETVTLRDLLAHQTGIPGHNNVRYQDFAREEIADRIRFANRTETFRASYIYNNLMYGLISYITEVIGMDSWENLMRKHIFQPLGMNASTFIHELSREDFQQMALPYLYDEDNSWRPTSYELHSQWSKLGGSGSIVSTAPDMARWLLFQLNQQTHIDGDQVLPHEIVEDTHRRVKVIPHGSDDALYRRPHSPVTYSFDEYSLGWRRGYYRGYTMVLHTGTSWGYGALLTLIPDLNIGVFTSISGPDSGYRARRALHMYIIDLLSGETPFLNKDNISTYPDSMRSYRPRTVDDKGVQASSLDLTVYEGQYGNFLYGNLSIEINSTTGRLQLIYGSIGLWDLYSSDVNNTFTGQGLEHVWSSRLSEVIFDNFDEDSRLMQTVSIPSFERKEPPMFVRGRLMSEAPEPDIPTC